MSIASLNGTAQEEPLPALDNDLFEEIEQLTPRMLAQVSQLDEYREQLLAIHRQQLEEVEQRKRKLIALLKQMGIEVERKVKRKGSPKPKVGIATIIGMLEAILAKRDDEYFTLLGLYEEHKFPWGQAHAYVALNYLKSAEVIRRDRQLPGGRWQFAILDRQVGEKLLAQCRAAASSQATTRDSSISSERLEIVKEAAIELMKDSDKGVRFAQLEEATGINKTSVRDAVRILVARGELVEGPSIRFGPTGHPSKTFLLPQVSHAAS